jgi:hypothetical protein
VSFAAFEIARLQHHCQLLLEPCAFEPKFNLRVHRSCPQGSNECKTGHLSDFIPDIMVWSGRAGDERFGRGFYKFFTTCAQVYQVRTPNADHRADETLY